MMRCFLLSTSLVLLLASNAWAEGRFVAVGEQGVILTSQDLETWTYVETDNRLTLNSISAGDGSADAPFIAIGNYRILRSFDGLHWETTWDVPDRTGWSRVDYLDGRYMASGYWTPPTDRFPAVIGCARLQVALVREIGMDGTFGDIIFQNWPDDYLCEDRNFVANSMTYGNETYVVVGDQLQRSYRSDDLIDWHAAQYWGANDGRVLNKVIYARGLFVAGGDVSRLMYSTGALSQGYDEGWQYGQYTSDCTGDTYLADGSPGYTIHDILYDGRQFFAVADGARLFRSADGINWTRHTLSGDPCELNLDTNLRGIAHGEVVGPDWVDDVYVIVGENGSLYGSWSGNLWFEIETPTGLDLYSVAYKEVEHSSSCFEAVCYSTDERRLPTPPAEESAP